MKSIHKYFSSNKKVSLISEYLISKSESSKNNKLSSNKNIEYIYNKMLDSDIDASLLTKYEDCLEKLIEFNKASAYVDNIYQSLCFILSKPTWTIFTGQLPDLKTIKFEYIEDQEFHLGMLSNTTTKENVVCVTIVGRENNKSIKLYIGKNKAAMTLYEAKQKYLWWAYSWNNTTMDDIPNLIYLNDEKVRHLCTAVEKNILGHN